MDKNARLCFFLHPLAVLLVLVIFPFAALTACECPCPCARVYVCVCARCCVPLYSIRSVQSFIFSLSLLLFVVDFFGLLLCTTGHTDYGALVLHTAHGVYMECCVYGIVALFALSLARSIVRPLCTVLLSVSLHTIEPVSENGTDSRTEDAHRRNGTRVHRRRIRRSEPE